MRAYYHGFMLILTFLLGCTDMGSGPVRLTASALDSSIDGKTVELALDQNFSLELDVHADGGFQWDYQIGDTTVVTMARDPSYRPKSGQWLDGGLTVETFYFRTARTGGCVIRLTEHRGWEKDIPPLNTVEFTVHVI